MTSNRDWLFSLPLDEQIAWMNAEHQDGTLDGDTAALNARIAELERKLRISWEYECKFQDERDALQEQVDKLTAKRDESAELLSQSHRDWLDDVGEYEEIIDKLKSELNTAVCDNNSLRYELECLEENKTKVWCDCDCCKWQEEREKLTAERDELQRHCKNQRRELAELNNVVNVHRIVHEDGQVDVFSVRELCRRNDELTAERERYREKFGKCLDYADAIHALMDDEGMA